MKRMSVEEFKKSNFVTCECGYNNFKSYIERYGTCRGCGKVLNHKAKFEYEMVCKLRLWRKNESN